jgi:hypothetical protein
VSTQLQLTNISYHNWKSRLKILNISLHESRRPRGKMQYLASNLTLKFSKTRMTQLSATRVGPSIPPTKFLGTHFC